MQMESEVITFFLNIYIHRIAYSSFQNQEWLPFMYTGLHLPVLAIANI